MIRGVVRTVSTSPGGKHRSPRQDPVVLGPRPPALVGQGGCLRYERCRHAPTETRATPRSEANPASRTRMWRPTVFSRELAPLNTATVLPVCDRASDPYQRLSVGVRVRQAAAQRANRPTSRRGGCRAWLGKPCAGWARPSTAPRSSSGPTVISSQKRLGGKPHDRGTRVVERRTAAGAPATRAESSSRTSPAPERRGRPSASLSRKSIHVARTPSGSSLARRHHRLRP